MIILACKPVNALDCAPRFCKAIDISDEEPIEIFSLTDENSWKKQLYRKFNTDNQVKLEPQDDCEKGSLMLDKLNIDKWSDFEAKATMYTIHLSAGYKTIYATITNDQKVWQTESHMRKFSSYAPNSAIIEALAFEIYLQHEKEMRESQVKLLRI